MIELIRAHKMKDTRNECNVLPYEFAIACCASLFPFSLASFARVFLFSLTPVYFFLLSSPRTYVTAVAVASLKHCQLSSSSSNSKSPAVIQSDLLTFRSSRMTFFLSLSLSLFIQNRCSPMRSSSFSLTLLRSILLHFSRDRSSPFFSPPSLHTPSSSLPFLGLGLLLLLSSHSRSSVLLDSVSSPLRSSDFLPSSATSSRRDIAKKSPRISRCATWWIMIFPNHNLSDALFIDISVAFGYFQRKIFVVRVYHGILSASSKISLRA